MKKIYHNLLLLAAGFMFITACSDADPLPDNVIYAPEGLQLKLDWSTGTTAEDALQEVDLDLKLMRDTETVGRSENVTRFESVNMYKTLHNGDFRVDVAAYKVTKKTDFILTISDSENLTSKVYTSFFHRGEKLTLPFLKIRKEGDHYTIIPNKKQ